MINRNFWFAVLLAILTALLVAVVYIFWPTAEDLSNLANVGTSYNVRILRDTWGVPHIFGVTDADVAYGLAYAHAEDNFLTIQQTVVAARGHLARVYGRDSAPNDYMVQLLRIWDVVNATYETGISPEMRHILEAYANGLNHYAALHEEEVLPGLFPVSGKDIAAGFVHRTPLFFNLDGVLGELFAETRQREVSAFGSNTFAVAPSRTANGETFLAVNAHQPWQGPATWYEAHLHSEEGWDMVGGLFPGAPTIIHGHNRNLGWAFTVNSPDLIDVYVLEINPDNPDQYLFDGRWLDLEVREALITVKLIGRLTWPVRREVLWSVYGPTVRQEHGTYAIRLAGFGDVGLPEQLYRLNKANNFAEWQQAMRDGSLPMFNVGYADREGNIYYLYNGRLPIRAEGYDWEQYLPGNTSETLWTAYLPFDQLPQVLNPPSGFLQNANSSPFQTTWGAGNPDPAAYSPTLGIETYMTNRAYRALLLFGLDGSITQEEFDAYKYDTRYGAGSDIYEMIEIILNAPAPDDPDEQAAVEVLRNWDLNTNAASSGAALTLMTLHYLNEADAADVSPSRLVGNELPPQVVLESFSQAVALLKENFGQINPLWQAVNRLQRGNTDLGLGGGPDVLHAIYGQLQASGQLRAFVGDSYVLLVTWDANGNVASRSIHQYGSATLDENSPHYDDQSPLFANQELKPIWLNEADIRAHLEREYRPGEEVR